MLPPPRAPVCPQCLVLCRDCPRGPLAAHKPERRSGSDRPAVGRKLHVGVDGSDIEYAVFQQLGDSQALWTGEGEVHPPSSKTVRCSGRLMLEMTRCRSYSFFGSHLASERETPLFD